MASIEVIVSVNPDELRLEVPSLGLSCREPVLAVVHIEKGRGRVGSVGREAEDGPRSRKGEREGDPEVCVVPWQQSESFARWLAEPSDAPPSTPVGASEYVRVNPLRATPRTERMLVILSPQIHFELSALLHEASWFARLWSDLTRRFRYTVETRDLPPSEHLHDAIARGLMAFRRGPITIDGETWYEPPSEHPGAFVPPRSRSDLFELAIVGALCAAMIWFGPTFVRQRFNLRQAGVLSAILSLGAARWLLEVAWHLRQLRRRRVQHARLLALTPAAARPLDLTRPRA